MDLLLGVDHDVVWNNGPLTKEYTTQPYTQTVAQRLKILLLSFKNEYFWNTEYGVDYWGRILGQKQKSKAGVDLLFQQAILSEPGVKEIVTFNSTFANRVYSLTFSVRVVDGSVTEPISVNPVN